MNPSNGSPRHLVTGSGGFSGRSLLARLRAQPGSESVGLVRDSPAAGEMSCDLGQHASVRRVLEAVRPSRIYHLAGSFTNDWGRDLQSNVETTRVLLEAVRSLALPCRILLVGSAAEYGDVSPGPVGERTPLRPVSVYGLTKVLQTELMAYYHRRFGMHLVLARTFNLFGQGCPRALFPGHVEQEIARVKAGLQRKVRVRDLSPERDYLPVDEAARAYVRILEHGEPGEVYNVGSGIPLRMSEFLARQLESHGLPFEAVEVQAFQSGEVANPSRVFADIRKYTALPG